MAFTDGKNIFREMRYDDGTVYGCDCEGAFEECRSCQWAGCPMRPENHVSKLPMSKGVIDR